MTEPNPREASPIFTKAEQAAVEEWAKKMAAAMPPPTPEQREIIRSIMGEPRDDQGK